MGHAGALVPGRKRAEADDDRRVDPSQGLEVAGWPHPKHQAGHTRGAVVRGDGVEHVRCARSNGFHRMGLLGAGSMSPLDRVIGRHAPYATSHDALDEDSGAQEDKCAMSAPARRK
jgi:hypothetical protein